MVDDIFERIIAMGTGTVIDTGSELGMLHNAKILPDGRLSVTIRFPRNLFTSKEPDILTFTRDEAKNYELDKWSNGDLIEYITLVIHIAKKYNKVQTI